MGQQRGLVHTAALLEFDKRTRRLAPLAVRACDHRSGQYRRMPAQRVLDLDRGDVLATGNDHILGTVADLRIAIRVDHGQVTGMEPAAGKCLGGGPRIVQVALHGDVAAEHDLAQGLPVVRHRLQGQGIEHLHVLLQQTGHALAAVALCTLIGRQRLPFRSRRAQRRRAIHLGQAVDMGHVHAHRLQRLDHRRRRRGPGNLGMHRAQAGLPAIRGSSQRGMDHRRTAVMGHLMLTHQFQHVVHLEAAQADLGGANGRQRPRKAPAIAVEHRQRPQVDRLAVDAPVDDIGHRIEIGAAVVVDHPLRIAGGAGGIVQRNRIPLIGGQLPGKVRIATSQQRLVLTFPQPLPVDHGRVVDIDHPWPLPAQRQRLRHHRRELAVGKQHLGTAMVEHEGQGGRIQPGVERVQYRPEHGRGKVQLDHRWHVGQHHRHGIALADAHARQRTGQAAAALGDFPPAQAALTMDHGQAPGMQALGLAQEAQR